MRDSCEEYNRRCGFVRVFPSHDSWDLYRSASIIPYTLRDLLCTFVCVQFISGEQGTPESDPTPRTLPWNVSFIPTTLCVIAEVCVCSPLRIIRGSHSSTPLSSVIAKRYVKTLLSFMCVCVALSFSSRVNFTATQQAVSIHYKPVLFHSGTSRVRVTHPLA